MGLEREPNPQPAPEATGAIGENKKLRLISGAAVGFGLLMAMLLGWMWTVIHRPVKEQRSTRSAPTATKNASENQRGLDEAKEKAYEEGLRKGAQSNPSFNTEARSGAGVEDSRAQAPAATPKRTPKDDYDDLLAKAAVADSTVEGEKGVSRVAAALKDSLPSLPVPPAQSQTTEEHKSESKLRPVGQNEIPAGTFIDCSLINELNGDNVGPVKVQVSTNVYNPQTLDLAIPQGSVFIGEAQKVSAQFQQRLAVAFDRLQLRRDGKLYEIKLDRIPGLDQQGATALKDKVNNHYGTTFVAALAIGALGGLAQIGSGNYGGYNGISASTEVRNGISNQMAQSASQVFDRFLTHLPSVIIRPGKPVIVYFPFGVDLS
jgi:type IV secretion system protein VirB10